MEITFERAEGLAVETFRNVLIASGLATRRPVDDHSRLARMLEHSNLIVVAKQGEKVIGVARSLTDFAYCCYLSDLAVDEAFKGRRIGKRLIEETRRIAGPQSMCLLLASPDAEPFYHRIGMPQASRAFLYPREN